MRVRLTRRAGQPGTKRLLERYGRDLVCVRYRYDELLEERLKTVEIVVSRRGWRERRGRADDSVPVRFRLEKGEGLLRRAVLIAGGRWDEVSDSWSLPRRLAKELGLTSRLIRTRKR